MSEPQRRPDCLLIEGCDFDQFPAGGQLATAKQLMGAFGPRLALVGICTDRETPVGRWVTREFKGTRFHFYGIGRSERRSSKPRVPARLTQLLRLAGHREGVLSLGVRAAILQAPEDLIVASGWKLDSLCYWFPGVANPLYRSRFSWGAPFARMFDRMLFDALAHADTILASADHTAIEGLVARSGGKLSRDRISMMPTFFDSSVFAPADYEECRARLRVDSDECVVACSGRLNRMKGWDLALAAFRLFLQEVPTARLVFIGDGEDRAQLRSEADAAGVGEKVNITGFLAPAEVATWLNASDLVVVGSHSEGWSVAMLEALACGKPLVTTRVSGATAMVQQGVNGYVVNERSPELFADAMARAVRLPRAREASLACARQFDSANLARCVGERWRVLA